MVSDCDSHREITLAGPEEWKKQSLVEKGRIPAVSATCCGHSGREGLVPAGPVAGLAWWTR